jgi:hypothetical protein
MIPEEDEQLIDPNWKPFEIVKTSDGKFQTSMLGSTSDEFDNMSDALVYAMEIMVDAWLHHLNVEHDWVLNIDMDEEE